MLNEQILFNILANEDEAINVAICLWLLKTALFCCDNTLFPTLRTKKKLMDGIFFVQK